MKLEGNHMSEATIDATRDPFTPQGRRVVVVSGGLSDASSSTQLARALAEATENALSKAGARPDVKVVELRPLAHAIMDAVTTFNPSDELEAIIQQVYHADGVIAVSPTFQASYSGLFKAFWDLFEDPLTHTPVMLGATGGTARHSLMIDYAMRPLFSYLRADVLPHAVFAATDDWGEVEDGSQSAKSSDLFARIQRAGITFADILLSRDARSQPASLDGGEDTPLEVTPFDQLLKGLGQQE